MHRLFSDVEALEHGFGGEGPFRETSTITEEQTPPAAAFHGSNILRVVRVLHWVGVGGDHRMCIPSDLAPAEG
jgi:hypothetical protein